MLPVLFADLTHRNAGGFQPAAQRVDADPQLFGHFHRLTALFCHQPHGSGFERIVVSWGCGSFFHFLLFHSVCSFAFQFTTLFSVCQFGYGGNTHEPLVSKEDFARVQELIATRRRQQKDGSTQIFSGLVKCADCGWSLAFSTNRQNKKPYSYYHCSKNGQGLHQCTMHYIRYDVLYTYVLARVQYWAGQAALP